MRPRETLVRTCLTAIGAGDADTWLSCYADDAISHDTPPDSVREGRAGPGDGVRSRPKAVPDTRRELRSLHMGERFGTCEWTMSGTLRGSVDGLPRTRSPSPREGASPCAG